MSQQNDDLWPSQVICWQHRVRKKGNHLYRSCRNWCQKLSSGPFLSPTVSVQLCIMIIIVYHINVIKIKRKKTVRTIINRFFPSLQVFNWRLEYFTIYTLWPQQWDQVAHITLVTFTQLVTILSSSFVNTICILHSARPSSAWRFSCTEQTEEKKPNGKLEEFQRPKIGFEHPSHRVQWFVFNHFFWRFFCSPLVRYLNASGNDGLLHRSNGTPAQQQHEK